MAPAYETYLRRVKHGLCCSRTEQKRLITALEQEILDTIPNADHVPLARIEEQFGPPEVMAQELQQTLPDDTAAQTARKRLRRMCLFFSLCLLAAVLIAGAIIYQEHIKAENKPPEIITVTPRPPIYELPPASYLPEE